MTRWIKNWFVSLFIILLVRFVLEFFSSLNNAQWKSNFFVDFLSSHFPSEWSNKDFNQLFDYAFSSLLRLSNVWFLFTFFSWKTSNVFSVGKCNQFFIFIVLLFSTTWTNFVIDFDLASESRTHAIHLRRTRICFTFGFSLLFRWRNKIVIWDKNTGIRYFYFCLVFGFGFFHDYREIYMMTDAIV